MDSFIACSLQPDRQSGFNGYGQRVEFKQHDSNTEHAFFVKVQRSGSDFPLEIELFRSGKPVASANGDTNGLWLKTPTN